MYVKDFNRGIKFIFKFIFNTRSGREYLIYVPKYCKNCDELGICRDENNKWKCRNGCHLIKNK